MFNFTKLKPLLFFNKNLYQHKSVELRRFPSDHFKGLTDLPETHKPKNGFVEWRM
jgi:hypothetical protein